MSFKKIVRFILVIIILILLFTIIRSTYSKYTNLAVANVEERIGNWVIKINDKDVTTVDEFGNFGVFEIDDFTWNWSESPHVKEPKVAPGMKGYFDLKIDPTGTDVSIKYTLTIDDSKIAEFKIGQGKEVTLPTVYVNDKDKTLSLNVMYYINSPENSYGAKRKRGNGRRGILRYFK